MKRMGEESKEKEENPKKQEGGNFLNKSSPLEQERECNEKKQLVATREGEAL